METFGETDCCLDLFPASLRGLDARENPHLAAGDEPLVCDMRQSLIDVRRFEGGSAVKSSPECCKKLYFSFVCIS